MQEEIGDMQKINPEAMWLMLQQKKPEDYVIATGKQYSIKDFINITSRELKLNIFWKKNKNNEEIALNENKDLIIFYKRYFRPIEVHNLIICIF